jgi:hypothetical protein
MSVAPPFPDRQDNPKVPNRIWIRDVDPEGRPVDRRFIEAAYRKQADFFRYRADELNDEAVKANLIEDSVYRASKAEKTEPLRDVGGYLFKVFANLVDRELDRAPRLVDSEPHILELLPASRCETSQQIINTIYLREILGELDPEIRWAIQRRNLGYEVQEIASELEISADCLSTRIRRSLKLALKRLLGDNVR